MESEFTNTIADVRNLIEQRRYAECEAVVATAMFEHPHAAEPHNLMGLLLEQEGRHPDAMCHFRAACALNPTYRPALCNLDCFGSLYRTAEPVYQESECQKATVKEW
ncbi:MAG: hypothetical protein LKJ80_01800 [Oscillibacter sp.]|jgi:Flp pilus assembly protein TadD|nr:hypothetical protein [Oscillibacter sp.]